MPHQHCGCGTHCRGAIFYQPVRVTPPAITPVALADAKAHLDIDYTDKDALITGLINSAVSHLDGWDGALGGRCLVEQTWRQDFDRFERCLRLPLAPVISITDVKYDDSAGVEQTVATADYELLTDAFGAYVRFKEAFAFPDIDPQGPSVRVTYLTGYPTVTGVTTTPDAIKHAILMLVRHWFDNPSATVVGVSAQSMPMAAEALLAPFRRMHV